MSRLPMFLDVHGMTLRVNPRGSSTGWICLQIMEPPQCDNEGTPTRDGQFTQIYLSREHAKALADILHAEAVLELIP